MMDRQTDKQKNHISGSTSGMQSQSSTKLGKMTEDLEQVLTPQKSFGIWCTVLLSGALKILGASRPLQIQTPVTLEPLHISSSLT